MLIVPNFLWHRGALYTDSSAKVIKRSTTNLKDY